MAPERLVPRLSMTIQVAARRSGPSMSRYDAAESIDG